MDYLEKLIRALGRQSLKISVWPLYGEADGIGAVLLLFVIAVLIGLK